MEVTRHQVPSVLPRVLSVPEVKYYLFSGNLPHMHRYWEEDPFLAVGHFSYVYLPKIKEIKVFKLQTHVAQSVLEDSGLFDVYFAVHNQVQKHLSDPPRAIHSSNREELKSTN